MHGTKDLFLSFAQDFPFNPLDAAAEVCLDATAELAAREGDCPDFWEFPQRGDVSTLDERFAHSRQGAFAQMSENDLKRLGKFSRRLHVRLEGSRSQEMVV